MRRCTFVHMYQTMRKTFRHLIAWREAHTLTLMMYGITRTFPADERFGMTSQMRRASSSIGAQIAEGCQMPTIAHRKLYYDRAYASVAEVDNFLELAKDLTYINEETYRLSLAQLNKVGFLTHKLAASQNSPSPLTAPTYPTYPTSSPTPASRNRARGAAHSPDESIPAPRRR